ncbi:hypothetical protein QFZ78_004288 [Paenibacillus sp. V4I5]|nr:hypothetical protein [Paenibacillus sp. V4I5]
MLSAAFSLMFIELTLSVSVTKALIARVYPPNEILNCVKVATFHMNFIFYFYLTYSIEQLLKQLLGLDVLRIFIL